ncbi:MAG: BON domain-containing protein [Planctomycetes bacterium]|nr:BON domain-containing protein [Planctomycetota bacterium]
MKVRALFPLAAAAGFWLAGPTQAQQPAALPVAVANPNQSLADSVASRLRATSAADGADVNISCQDGSVTLMGSAKDAAQRSAIIREVQGVSGVVLVRNGIRVSTDVVQVQDTAPPITAPVAPYPLAPQGGPPGGNPIVEPVPLGTPGQYSPDMQAPNLPPYAWPTYAPYNNVSRVGYPTAYPYNAFPFIGPYYPFPKVPLGWRKVTLEWDDGHWYIGRNSAPQDYWRVKFW